MKTNDDKRQNEDTLKAAEAEDLFDEMSVVELEDRLELVRRCVCRNAAQ